jgi:tetratricopeptide (TPR) repeat protein
MAGNRELYNKLMNNGHSAAWDQSWEKAAEFYRQAINEFPEDPKAITNLALALLEMGRLEEALVQYHRAAQVSPEDPIPLEKVAELLEGSGRVDQSIEAYMRSADLYVRNRDISKGIDLWNHVITLNPEVVLAHSRLAMVFERLGRKVEAIRSYVVIASIFQHRGDVQKAIQAITRALQIQPDNSEAGQALSMVRMGRMLPRPMAARLHSVDLKPAKSEPAKLPGSENGAEQAKPPTADPITETRQKAVSSLAGLVFELMEDSSEETQPGMGKILGGGRSSSSATSPSIEPGEILTHLNGAIAAISAKSDDLALDELNASVEAGLDHPAVSYVLGCLLIDAQRMESGNRFLQRLSQHAEYGLAANLLQGQTLLKMNRRRESAVCLLQALRIADLRVAPPAALPSLSQTYDSLIEAYQQNTAQEPSEQLCQSILSLLLRQDWQDQVLRARQQLPSDESPLTDLITEAGSSEIVGMLSLINRLARSGQHRTAMEEAYHALIVAPTYLPLHVTMGEILLSQGQVNDAIAKFQATAHTYAARQEVSKAVTLYRRVIELSPMNLEIRGTLINLLKENELFAEAIQEYVALAEIYYSLAEIPSVRNTLAQAYSLAHDHNLSKEVHVQLLTRIADIEMQSLEWRQALSAYEQIRLINPTDETIRHTIIDLHFRLRQASQAVAEITSYIKLLIENRQVTQAVSFLEKLAEEHPEEPYVLRQLGDAYRQIGHIEEALARYDAAAEAFLVKNNRPAAVETIMAILALNPPNAAEYQQMLSHLR